MAGVPRNSQAFDDIDDPKKKHTEKGKQNKRGEHERQVEIANRPLKYVANSGIRANKFTNDCTDNAKRDGYLQARKDCGRSVWQTDHAEDLKLTCLHCTGKIEHVTLDRLEALYR